MVARRRQSGQYALVAADGGAGCREALRGLRRDCSSGTEVLVIEVHDHGDPGLRDLIAYPMSRSGDQVDGDFQLVGLDCAVPEPAMTVDKARTAAEFVAACWAEVGVETPLPPARLELLPPLWPSSR